MLLSSYVRSKECIEKYGPNIAAAIRADGTVLVIAVSLCMFIFSLSPPLHSTSLLSSPLLSTPFPPLPSPPLYSTPLPSSPLLSTTLLSPPPLPSLSPLFLSIPLYTTIYHSLHIVILRIVSTLPQCHGSQSICRSFHTVNLECYWSISFL